MVDKEGDELTNAERCFVTGEIIDITICSECDHPVCVHSRNKERAP